MIVLDQERAQLEQLGLEEAALVLDSRLEAATHKQLPYAEFLVDLLGVDAPAVPAHPRRLRLWLPAVDRQTPGEGAGHTRVPARCPQRAPARTAWRGQDAPGGGALDTGYLIRVTACT